MGLIEDEEAKRRTLSMLRTLMGPDVLRFLQDKTVFEIIVNPDGALWVDTHTEKGRYDTGIKLDGKNVKQLIFQIGFLTNQVCDEKFPMLQAELPDGSRFQGFLPNVVTGPSYIIRKHSDQIFTLDDYVSQGVMTEQQKDVICKAVKEKKNIIAAGGTKSGKTTLLNAILAEVAKYNDRIVMIEDLPELKCATNNLLSLRTTDSVDQDALLKATLRATPDRIVVGEVRGGEALTLLDAWSTGHSGGCSTVHANSAVQTLNRLEHMITRVSLSPQQHTIVEAVDVVIYIKLKANKRYIEEIIRVDDFDEITQKYLTTKLA